MSNYGDNRFNHERRLIRMKVLNNLEGGTESLSKVFEVKLNQALNSQKMTASNYYFIMPGYRSIFARRRKKLHKNLENICCRERNEAYEKLWKTNSNESQDTFWWRRANVSDTLRSGFDSNSSSELDQPGTDQLFRNDVARQAFWKFLKFGVSSSMEFSISSLICFDVSLMDGIDSLFNNIDANHTIQAYHTSTDKIQSDLLHIWPIVPSQDSTIPQECLRKFKLLPPLPSRNQLCFCYMTFRKHCSECSVSECVEKFPRQQKLKNY